MATVDRDIVVGHLGSTARRLADPIESKPQGHVSQYEALLLLREIEGDLEYSHRNLEVALSALARPQAVVSPPAGADDPVNEVRWVPFVPVRSICALVFSCVMTCAGIAAAIAGVGILQWGALVIGGFALGIVAIVTLARLMRISNERKDDPAIRALEAAARQRTVRASLGA